MPPAAYFFLACQKRGFSTPLSFPHGKESAVDGRKKGRQRGSCVGTNSTSLILSAASGGQASSVPLFLLFPHESLRWIRVGALSPLQTPLKRPRRGLRPPSLDFPRGLVCAEFVFRLSKRATDASLIDRRGSRNTLRLFRMYLAWKSVCARYAMQPLQEGRPFDFHMSNIQRAQTKRLARYIVRLGNPIRRPPEGRSLPGALSVNGTQKQSAFSGATALFGVQRSFLPYLFCQDRKDMARGAAVTALRIEPRPRRIRNGPAEQNPCLRRKAHLCC